MTLSPLQPRRLGSISHVLLWMLAVERIETSLALGELVIEERMTCSIFSLYRKRDVWSSWINKNSSVLVRASSSNSSDFRKRACVQEGTRIEGRTLYVTLCSSWYILPSVSKTCPRIPAIWPDLTRAQYMGTSGQGHERAGVETNHWLLRHIRILALEPRQRFQG